MSTLFRVPDGYTLHCFQNHIESILALPDDPKTIVAWDTDSEEAITRFKHLRIFRTSLRRSVKHDNECALPAHLNYSFSSYFTHNNSVPLVPAPFHPRPTVGFCGNASHPARQRMNAVFVNDSRVDSCIYDTRAFIKEHINKKPLFERYLATMHACPFILCCRGAGNWSIRFYETLCAGRIPVLLDTDVVLPKEDKIDWDSVIIKDVDTLTLVQKVIAWHGRGPAFLLAAQRQIIIELHLFFLINHSLMAFAIVLH